MIGIKERITGQISRPKESDLVDIHHRIMKVYGWIPLDEFKEIPIPTLLSLNEKVSKDIQKQEQLRLVILKYCGVKNPK